MIIDNEGKNLNSSGKIGMSRQVIRNKGYNLGKIVPIKVLYFHFLVQVDTLWQQKGDDQQCPR